MHILRLSPKRQLQRDLGREISNFCIPRKLKCWTQMCEDLETYGYVFLVSRNLCIWITACLQRLLRAFLCHTLPYRYQQSKSHFRLLSPFFNMALRHFRKFHVICQKLTRKEKKKIKIKWKWKVKLIKLFGKNVSLLFWSNFHNFAGNGITISRAEILITFDMQMDIRQLFFVPILHSPVCCHHKCWKRCVLQIYYNNTIKIHSWSSLNIHFSSGKINIHWYKQPFFGHVVHKWN